MDITSVDRAVQRYLEKCVAPSTRASYASAHRRYISFCANLPGSQPFPLTEGTLTRFAAFLGLQNLKHRTIKGYLSGLRFAQIHQGLGNPFHGQPMPLLEYVLTGL